MKQFSKLSCMLKLNWNWSRPQLCWCFDAWSNSFFFNKMQPIFFQVEICRYGCPDHCQRPNSYSAQGREQEVSSSINVPQYKPGPRFEAHKNPDHNKLRRQDNEIRNNEIPQPARLVAPQVQPQPKPQPQLQPQPAPAPLPIPQQLVQPRPQAPEIQETVRSVGNKPQKVIKPWHTLLHSLKFVSYSF